MLKCIEIIKKIGSKLNNKSETDYYKTINM